MGRKEISRLKRRTVLLCIISFVFALTGSRADTLAETKAGGETAARISPEEEENRAPKLSRIQGICELAVLDCYYHNVAKSVKEPGTGLRHFGEKERLFWIEYTGVAEISFQSDLIEMERHGREITITLPPPEVTCRVDPDSWNESSYVISKDQWIQKNPITAKDQIRAVEAAQEDMRKLVEENPSILENARVQARTLIDNYIDQTGRAAGVAYHVLWNEENEESTGRRIISGRSTVFADSYSKMN